MGVSDITQVTFSSEDVSKDGNLLPCSNLTGTINNGTRFSFECGLPTKRGMHEAGDEAHSLLLDSYGCITHHHITVTTHTKMQCTCLNQGKSVIFIVFLHRACYGRVIVRLSLRLSWLSCTFNYSLSCIAVVFSAITIVL